MARLRDPAQPTPPSSSSVPDQRSFASDRNAAQSSAPSALTPAARYVPSEAPLSARHSAVTHRLDATDATSSPQLPTVKGIEPSSMDTAALSPPCAPADSRPLLLCHTRSISALVPPPLTPFKRRKISPPVEPPLPAYKASPSSNPLPQARHHHHLLLPPHFHSKRVPSHSNLRTSPFFSKSGRRRDSSPVSPPRHSLFSRSIAMPLSLSCAHPRLAFPSSNTRSPRAEPSRRGPSPPAAAELPSSTPCTRECVP